MSGPIPAPSHAVGNFGHAPNKVVRAAIVLALAGTFALPFAGEAKAPSIPPPLVIRNDPGGYLNARLQQIRELRRSARPVEIRGGHCNSTCTMLIGLPQTCVSRDTTFGFHGPSSRDEPMEPWRFELASRVMAQYYPPELRRWFMDTGRFRTDGVYRLNGAEIIAYGVLECR